MTLKEIQSIQDQSPESYNMLKKGTIQKLINIAKAAKDMMRMENDQDHMMAYGALDKTLRELEKE